MSDNFNNHLKTLLKQDTRLVDEEGELIMNKLKDFANNLDPELIEILLSDDKAREKFFLQIKEIYVFKNKDFIFYLEQNNLDNSFTKYGIEIGLSFNGKFLKNNNDLVLDFPFKDCVLEGGQSTEEGNDIYYMFDEEAAKYEEKNIKRKEIFYNNIIAKDEIDRLTENKAFENVRKFDKVGKSVPKKFNRNGEGVITDNLIIKGNNLLALHSLLSEFKGRIKLIYIDPPYNTGSDSFAYNDKFNHSSWLTFMKNRLDVAHELLSDDGVIFVQCDDKEESYLKILMDEIFTRQCFVSKITWQRTPEGRTALGQGSVFINNSSEYIISFCKNSLKKPTKSKILKSIDATEKALGQYEYRFANEGVRELENVIKDSRGNEIKLYKHSNYVLEKIKSDVAVEDRLIDFDILVRLAAQQKESSLQQKILSSINREILYSVEYIPSSGKSKGELKKSFYFKDNILLFLKDYSSTDGSKVMRNAAMNDFWSHDEIQITGISEEGGVILKRGKKPEKLIHRIIGMATDEGDLILDYHLGSGTTAAVAHKMHRQYIGIEQLDYGDNDSVVRLINVIKGDLSGVSKEVKWNGGGSFIYLELAKNNEKAKDLINACTSFQDLESLFIELYEKYFLNYNVKIQEFKNKIVQEENFKTLSLDKQKEIFCRMLDNNQLYINVDDMEDGTYCLKPEDIRLTKDFYEIKD